MVQHFEKHTPSGDSIISQADTVSSTADRFVDIKGSLVSQHNIARSHVLGDLARTMSGAPTRVTTEATRLYTRAVVAAGAIGRFGDAVKSFNSKVDRWNSEIDSADEDDAQKVYEDLLPSYRREESALSEIARSSKDQLKNWDDDDTVTQLWKSGDLPKNAQSMLPDLDLRNGDLPQQPWEDSVSDVLQGLSMAGIGLSGTQAWQLHKRTRFAPRGANGRFISHNDYKTNNKWWQRAKENNSPRNYVAKPGQSANVARWAKVGKFAKVGGGAVTAASGAWSQWTEDADRKDLDTTHKAARAGTRAGFGVGGTAAGAAVGGVLGPPGAFVGGVVGGIAGDKLGELVVDSGAVDWTVDTASDAKDWVSDRASDAKDWVSDKLPW